MSQFTDNIKIFQRFPLGTQVMCSHSATDRKDGFGTVIGHELNPNGELVMVVKSATDPDYKYVFNQVYLSKLPKLEE